MINGEKGLIIVNMQLILEEPKVYKWLKKD